MENADVDLSYAIWTKEKDNRTSNFSQAAKRRQNVFRQTVDNLLHPFTGNSNKSTQKWGVGKPFDGSSSYGTVESIISWLDGASYITSTYIGTYSWQATQNESESS